MLLAGAVVLGWLVLLGDSCTVPPLFVTVLVVVFTGFGTEVNRKTSFLDPVNFFVDLHCISLFMGCVGSLLTVGLVSVPLVLLLLTNTYLLGREPDPNLVWL